MPPSQRSTSSRSAHKESSEIAADQSYALGEYSFRIERSSVPGSTNDQLTAICTQGGKNARKSIQIASSTQLSGWYVEANETTADVYAVVKVQTGGTEYSSDLNISGINQPIPTGGYYTRMAKRDNGPQVVRPSIQLSGKGIVLLSSLGLYSNTHYAALVASEEYEGASIIVENGNFITGEVTTEIVTAQNSYTYKNKTVYYTALGGSNNVGTPTSKTGYRETQEQIATGEEGKIAWTIVYGVASGGEYEEQEVLIGRFAIEIEDAGGAGANSDWSDPGDYDYDDYPYPDERDPEDPTYTLNLEVVGALSGRHNDPLEDTSYSYLPTDKATVKDYGCGGDGGNGGGGGAGASSIVVYKFATSRADSKEIVCKPKRHGYGSGGGKGGKGGDGCILIYY